VTDILPKPEHSFSSNADFDVVAELPNAAALFAFTALSMASIELLFIVLPNLLEPAP
jgi:hypothetical protein